jgi:cytochrome c oxidase subunit 3
MSMPGERPARPAAAGVDVGGLPTYVFGHGSMMWWGTMGLMVIESTVFALTIVT